MLGGRRDSQKRAFNLLPLATGIIFSCSAVLLVAWMLGKFITCLRPGVGRFFNFKFTTEEWTFFLIMMAASILFYLYYLVFRKYANKR